MATLGDQSGTHSATRGAMTPRDAADDATLADRTAEVDCPSRIAPGADDVGTLWWRAMQRGDFEAAWRQTDRLELPRRADAAAGRFVREPHHLLWNGEPFAGRHVLVRCN